IATLIYPLILITVATLIILYLVTYVVPQFAKLYADMHVALPATTELLLSLTGVNRAYIAGAAIMVLGGILGLVLWSRSERGGVAVDRLKLKVPALGDIWIKFQVAQFCRTLSTLLSGGTPLVSALSTAADSVGNRLLGTGIRHASQLVREGQ